MSVRLLWDDLQASNASRVGSAVGGLVLNARNAVCSVYATNPRFVVGPTPFNTVFDRFRTALWDRICNDAPSGLPPPAEQPFQGGQCNVDYLVVVSGVRAAGQQIEPFCVEQPFETAPGVIRGPILRTELRSPTTVTQGFCPPRGVWGQFVAILGRPPGDTRPPYEIVLASTNLLSASVSIVGRVDGQPDDCGQPQPEYPQLPPPALQPGDTFTTDVNVELNDGTDFTIPLIFAPVTVVNNLNIPVTLNLGGIRLDFNFDDINLNIGGSPSGDSSFIDQGDTVNNINETVNNINETVNNIEIDIDDLPLEIPNYDDELTDIQDDLRELLDRPPPEPSEPCDLQPVLDAIASFRQFVEGRFAALKDFLECFYSLFKESIPSTVQLSESPILLGEFTATFEDSVHVVPVPDRSLLYAIEIVGTIQPAMRVFKLSSEAENVEANFGNCGLLFGAGASTPAQSAGLQLITTRYTALLSPNTDITPIGVRVSVKPGLTVRVYDSGWRVGVEEAEDCVFAG